MAKIIRKWQLWIAYAVFAAIAVSQADNEPLLASSGPYAAGKYLVWTIYFGFLGFSIYCTTQENFFKTLGKMTSMHWGRQVGIDLYIGLLVPLFLIYLIEGSLVVVALWFIPIFIFANLATFLYLALNYVTIVAYFTAP